MSVLTGPEIVRQMRAGNIVIDPFDPKNVGPNSVDLHLGDTLLTYDLSGVPPINLPCAGYVHGEDVRAIDAKNPPPTVMVPKLKDGGWLLRPGVIYLGASKEWTETRGLVAYIDGRSSLGRLGVSCHVTAGRGDVGFCGCWTVEIFAVQPTVIYPGGRYFQVTFHEVEGERLEYTGRYQGDRGPAASRINR